MSQAEQQTQERLDILAAIRRGMPVYDSEYIKLGTVTRIYWGADTAHPNSDDFQVTFLGVSKLPPETATLIREEGCIRVDSGLLAADYYVLPHQVANITEEGMFLLVRGDGVLMY